MVASVAILNNYRGAKPFRSTRGGFVFGAEMAQRFGILEAVFIARLECLCERYGKEFEGHQWFRCTYEDWSNELASLWSKNTIIKAVRHLESERVIISRNFNKHKNIHTKYYRVNHNIILYSGEGLA